LDARIDAKMMRTKDRPLPSGGLNERQVLVFALLLAALSMALLVFGVNTLTAILTFASLIGYAIVYTVWLKRATPQNIVIGGAAGAAPPVLGWVAVTGEVHPYALVLFLIIFIWTPPHFWALAIFRRDDYAAAEVPMMPVTHGIAYTAFQVLLYTILLFIVSLMPYLIGMSGIFYLGGAVILGGAFLAYAVRLRNPPNELFAMRVFNYSIVYLMALFAFLLVDHYLPRPASMPASVIEFNAADD
jgi:heme o synthase